MGTTEKCRALLLFTKAEQLYNDEKIDEALECLKAAAAIDEQNARGWILAARIAADAGNTEAVYLALCKAVELEEFSALPQDVQRIVLDQLSSIYGNINQISRFIDCRLHISHLLNDNLRSCSVYSSYLYAMQAAQLHSAEEILNANIAYNKFFSSVKSFAGHELGSINSRRIRIGYLSADFCQHPVAFFMIKLLYFHNKERFEITCYSGGRNYDNVTEQIKSLCEHWHDISHLSYQEAAEHIYNDKIDILFDLGGHNVESWLPVLAYKPAPIQLSGIGYIGTTGLETVDYFLTDKYCDLQLDGELDFTEKLLFLPHSHFCYTMRCDIKEPQAAAYERTGSITFGVFNRIEKITDHMLQLWSVILKRVPQSRLLIKSGFVKNDFYCAIMYKRLKAAGINPANVILEPASPDYIDKYLQVDIALDTFPCCGGTTTCDALIMGVPVITMVGKRHVARFGYSILKNIGLDECIAFNDNEYIDKAVNLALNKEKLNWLHLNLRSQMKTSPLMDGQLYAAEIEKIYEKIVRQKE